MSFTTCFMFSPCKRYVYLILKKKPKWQEGRWTGIGGKTEEGESPCDTCIREVKEETGLNIQNPELFCELLVADGRGTIVFFLRYFLKSFQIPKTTEQEEIRAFKVSDLPENMLINLHWLIPMALIDTENIYRIEEELPR